MHVHNSPHASPSRRRSSARATPLTLACLIVAGLFIQRAATAAAAGSGAAAGGETAYVPFDGEKSTWHDGFDRYDYLLDEATLALAPFRAPQGERFAVHDPPQGKRRCVVVAPKRAAAGNPWSWRGCYWDHEPQAEVELLRRGFHVAYISANATLGPGPEWDAWYAFLTEKHGLSKKPAFVGMSRGGQYAYTWAVRHPDRVSCVYGDNPGASPEVFAGLGALAKNDVPLLHVCGSIDGLLWRVSNVIEGTYAVSGGRISVMIKEGAGHHPHSLRDPTPIADFIEQSAAPPPPSTPSYLAGRTTRSAFYGAHSTYRDVPAEGTFVTGRGPLFVPCYTRRTFELPGVEGAVTVIEPNEPAAGKPWVFRADAVARDSTVDLALLAKGFHVVTGPVPHTSDGPIRGAWDAVYQHLVAHGFSRRPVLAGAGRAAGEAYAWAIANPDKVACVYGENPILRSTASKQPLVDDLAPLAAAGVPILHVCGADDPSFEQGTRTAKQRYTDLGGTLTVITREGEGHYPTSPRDPRPVVEFITARTR
jgi:pimeloyl-ACP methyl ester carboxylesterase